MRNNRQAVLEHLHNARLAAYYCACENGGTKEAKEIHLIIDRAIIAIDVLEQEGLCYRDQD